MIMKKTSKWVWIVLSVQRQYAYVSVDMIWNLNASENDSVKTEHDVWTYLKRYLVFSLFFFFERATMPQAMDSSEKQTAVCKVLSQSVVSVSLPQSAKLWKISKYFLKVQKCENLKVLSFSLKVQNCGNLKVIFLFQSAKVWTEMLSSWTNQENIFWK